MATHSNRRVRDVQLRVDVDLHPGWVSGADVELEPGDIVMCTDGRAEVVKILGSNRGTAADCSSCDSRRPERSRSSRPHRTSSPSRKADACRLILNGSA